MASGENCREDIGASKCWQRRAIENGKEEETECSQVTEHRRNTVSATRCGILDEDVQPDSIISTSPDTFSGTVATFAVPDDGHGLGWAGLGRCCTGESRLLPPRWRRN